MHDMREDSNENATRRFLPGLGDLIDLMTVTQLRLVKLPASSEKDGRLHEDLSSDISVLMAESNLNWAALVERVISLSILNAEIWDLKDKMSTEGEGSGEYARLLTCAHQLNGFRNRLRNDLNALHGHGDGSIVRSNTGSDGMSRWIP